MKMIRRWTESVSAVAYRVAPFIVVATVIILLIAASFLFSCSRSSPESQADPVPVVVQPAPVQPQPVTRSVTIDGVTITAESGAPIEYERTVTEVPATLKRSAEGTGASFDASGEKIVSEFEQSTAPTSGLSGDMGGGASGGTTEVDATVIGAIGFNPLWLLSLACFGFAAFYALKKPLPDIKSALMCAAAGGGIAAFILWPSILVIIGIGAAGLYAVKAVDRRAKDTEEATRATSAGIESVPDLPYTPDPAFPKKVVVIPAEVVRRHVKASIGVSADKRDWATIERWKVADGLPVGRDPH